VLFFFSLVSSVAPQVIKVKSTPKRRSEADVGVVLDKLPAAATEASSPPVPPVATPSLAVGTPSTPKKSPRRLAQSAQPLLRDLNEDGTAAPASVQFENKAETIGEEGRRARKSAKGSTTGVKKKLRKRSTAQGATAAGLKVEVAAWKGKLSDAKNEGLVSKIEAMVGELAEKEPGLFRSASSTVVAAKAPESDQHQLHVAALQRLCRRWLQRREALRQPEARAVRERLRVWDSFIASEKKYFLTLLTVTQKCMRPLMAAAPQQVTEETLVEVFGSLPEIKDQSKTLLSKLRTGTNGAQWISSTGLGALFLNEVLPVLKSYVLYIVEYPKRIQVNCFLFSLFGSYFLFLGSGASDSQGARSAGCD
jgi:hypothetical protein